MAVKMIYERLHGALHTLTALRIFSDKHFIDKGQWDCCPKYLNVLLDLFHSSPTQVTPIKKQTYQSKAQPQSKTL